MLLDLLLSPWLYGHNQPGCRAWEAMVPKYGGPLGLVWHQQNPEELGRRVSWWCSKCSDSYYSSICYSSWMLYLQGAWQVVQNQLRRHYSSWLQNWERGNENPDQERKRYSQREQSARGKTQRRRSGLWKIFWCWQQEGWWSQWKGRSWRWQR